MQRPSDWLVMRSNLIAWLCLIKVLQVIDQLSDCKTDCCWSAGSSSISHSCSVFSNHITAGIISRRLMGHLESNQCPNPSSGSLVLSPLSFWLGLSLGSAAWCRMRWSLTPASTWSPSCPPSARSWRRSQTTDPKTWTGWSVQSVWFWTTRSSSLMSAGGFKVLHWSILSLVKIYVVFFLHQSNSSQHLFHILLILYLFQYFSYFLNYY